MLSYRSLLLFCLPAVAYAGATASAFKPEHRKGANYYNAQSAVDSNEETCWMVPGESPNRGEWIMLDIPKATVDKIGMNVGWTMSDETFSDYARVKSIKAEAFSLNDRQELSPTGSAVASYEDSADWQVVDVDDLSVGEDLFGGKLKISISDIYDGQDYPNLAVSELLVYLTEFDTQVSVIASSDAEGSHTVELMQDENKKTYWATPADGASFTVEASGFGVSSIGILPGPSSLSRPKTLEISANNRTRKQVLEDKTEVQWVMVPSITGYTGGAFGEIEVKIVDSYPGDSTAVGITEMTAKATNYEGF